MNKWQSKVAIVTGANSGNGLSILKKLAQSGVTVVGFDLTTEAIDVCYLQVSSLYSIE